MNTPELTYVQDNIHKMFPRVLRAHWPEFYKYLQTNFPGLRTSEQLYRHYHGEPTPCPCGQPTKYINFSKGYSKYCSCKCAAIYNQSAREQTNIKKYGVSTVLKLEEVQAKAKEPEVLTQAANTRLQTCRERYGVDNVSQSEASKQSYKQTCRERYGVDNTFSSSQIQANITQTNIYKYGVTNPGGASVIQQKIKQSMNDKYGADNISQSEWFKDNCLERLQENHPDVIRYEEVDGELMWVCKCPHTNCDQCSSKEYIIDRLTYYSRSHSTTPREMCTNLNPVGNHSKGTSIEQFVRDILDELGEQYETNVQLVCGNVDIYVPSRKLIVECNGTHWHSDRYKKQRFHVQRQAVARLNGYDLIYVWEDQIVRQGDNIRNLLKSKLGHFDHRVGARKCEVREITTTEANGILKYHLQGSCPASVKYGLFYKDQLVCVATFGKRKISGGSGMDWELIRFCCAPGWQIIGGASKLLKHFTDQHQPTTIISFSSNDISTGQLYKTLGFVKEKETLSYWIIDKKNVRHHRYTFRKSELVRKGWDKNLTEFEIEDQMGVYRIWDGGQTKWVLKQYPTT